LTKIPVIGDPIDQKTKQGITLCQKNQSKSSHPWTFRSPLRPQLRRCTHTAAAGRSNSEEANFGPENAVDKGPNEPLGSVDLAGAASGGTETKSGAIFGKSMETAQRSNRIREVRKSCVGIPQKRNARLKK